MACCCPRHAPPQPFGDGPHSTPPPHQWVCLRQLPVALWLVVPFVMLLTVSVSFAGLWALQSGQDTVTDTAEFSMAQVLRRVELFLNHKMQLAMHVNEMNVQAVKRQILDVQDEDTLRKFLYNRMVEFPFVAYQLGLPDGQWSSVMENDLGGPFSYGYARNDPTVTSTVHGFFLDEHGNVSDYVRSVENYTVQSRLWYQSAVRTRAAGWTQPDQYGDRPELAIRAHAPFYDAQDQLQGVFSVVVDFQAFGELLGSLRVCDDCHLVLVDAAGYVIADSTGRSPFQVLDSELYALRETSKFKRLRPEDSDAHEIAAAATHWHTTTNNPQTGINRTKFTSSGKQYTLVVSHLGPERDWQLGIVFGNEEFTRPLITCRLRIALVCIVTACISVLLGGLGAGLLTAPLHRLERMANAMAAGDLEAGVRPAGVCCVLLCCGVDRRGGWQFGVVLDVVRK